MTASTTVIAALGGYAVARLRFPGRESVASLILILYLIPPALLFIPLYRVLAEIGATDHLSALFLSYPTFTVPFCTWLLIGFFKALPDELEEAALIDGASRATAFVRVLLPLAAPGLVASAIFAFTLSWNEFLYALVFIQDERYRGPGRQPAEMPGRSETETAQPGRLGLVAAARPRCETQRP